MKCLERVPKQLAANSHFRLSLLSEARKDHKLREEIWQLCKEDILFYTNAFVFTFDPRTKDKSLPFITYPYQDEGILTIIDCIQKGKDLVIEKSRDMGASWISLLVMEWFWHFHAGYSFLMVSRKEDLVDAPGDPDALFWKLDFIHRHLPAWLLPGGGAAIDRRRKHFGNLDNGSTVDGESTTAAAGVGGRRTAMFIDEFSRIEEGHQLLAGTADTTNCRIFNFTPYGTTNAAYKLARRPDIKKLRFHWSVHPEKARGLYQYNDRTGGVEVKDKSYVYPPDYVFIMDGKLRSPWYDGECRRRSNDQEIAQMLDIDYSGSSYQFFSKQLIVELQKEYCVPPYWEGDIIFDPDTGRPLGREPLVKVPGGSLKLWLELGPDNKPPRGKYGGGCDLSTGSGATNSVFSVGNATTGEKVLEYASPYLKPEQMAQRVTALCWLFLDEDDEPLMLAWEQQGPGFVFGKAVINFGYRRVYYRTSEHSLKRTVSDMPGWYPGTDNKRVLLEEYRTALSSRRFVNRSIEALEECLAFVHTKNGTVEFADAESSIDLQTGELDPTGARINHGDRVVADALAWKMMLSFGKIARDAKKDEAPIGSLAWRRLIHDSASRAANRED